MADRINEENISASDTELSSEPNLELNTNEDNINAGDDGSADKTGEIDYAKINKGWEEESERTTYLSIHKLKYNRIITNFFLFETKRNEGRWSWFVILISTLTSGITLLNNIKEEDLPYINMKTYVNILLTVLSMLTSLIASWIKKQQYVDKINELDRYTQKINKLCEELQFELLKPVKDRLEYSKYTEKYFPLISEYLSSLPSISPKEWKECVHNITKNYPELLTMDGDNDSKLWPWYHGEWMGIRERTHFVEDIECEKKRCC